MNCTAQLNLATLAAGCSIFPTSFLHACHRHGAPPLTAAVPNPPLPAALCMTRPRRWAARWASRPSACRSSLWRRTARVSTASTAQHSHSTAQRPAGVWGEQPARRCQALRAPASCVQASAMLVLCIAWASLQWASTSGCLQPTLCCPAPLPAPRLADDREDPGQGAVLAGRVCGDPRGGEHSALPSTLAARGLFTADVF